MVGLRPKRLLKPKTAIVMRSRREEDIDSDEIVVDDIVIAKPGEKIVADGIIIIGESSIDESMITGESVPMERRLVIKLSVVPST